MDVCNNPGAAALGGSIFRRQSLLILIEDKDGSSVPEEAPPREVATESSV